MDSNTRRKKAKRNKLSRKRLKDGALLCIWPSLPSHLTKIVTPRPTSLASIESRQENSKRRLEKAEQDRILRDTFNSLDELKVKKDQISFPPQVSNEVSENFHHYYKLEFIDNIPTIRYSIQILPDLSYIVCLKNRKIPNLEIEGVKKIT